MDPQGLQGRTPSTNDPTTRTVNGIQVGRKRTFVSSPTRNRCTIVGKLRSFSVIAFWRICAFLEFFNVTLCTVPDALCKTNREFLSCQRISELEVSKDMNLTGSKNSCPSLSDMDWRGTFQDTSLFLRTGSFKTGPN